MALEPPTGIWPIVRTTIARGSPAVKRLVWQVGAFSGLMVALQIWDSRNARGAAGLAEFLSVMFGVCGVALLGVAATLRLAMGEGAQGDGRVPNPGVARVLLALPVVGFAAGAALGGAALLMVLRAVLGTELPLAIVGALVYTVMIVVAGRTVHHSARTLFDFAAEQARAAADQRTAATTARLEVLRARMNPHVLFNALNTVASLVRSNPPAAERVVMTLSDVLRQTLDRSSTEGTVADELDYVRSCLALEAERWGEQLQVSWHIDDRVLDWSMQPFVIQPLVENALRHGLGSRVDGGRVRIEVAGTDDMLSVAVEDDGLGFPPGWRERNGLGNLRQRLQALFGSAASLAVSPASLGGARVTVRLPARRVQRERLPAHR